MNRHTTRLLLAAVMALSALPLLARSPASAASVETILHIAEVGEVPFDAKPKIEAMLQTIDGFALVDQRLFVDVDGGEPKHRRTDAAGRLSTELPSERAPGVHRVTITFPGTSRYAPTRVWTDFTILRPFITIQTVPALAGVPFSLADVAVTTGSDGTARIPYDPAIVGQRPEPAPDTLLADGTTARFARWYGSRQSTMKATFEVYYPISLKFEDLDEQPVGPDDIESITIKSSTGARIEIEAADELLLQGSRVVPLGGGLESKDIYYTIESVMISGTSVVNRSQQRFVPSEVRDWSVELLFYRAEFKVRDAIFGFATGSGVRIEFPDGQIRLVPLSGDGTASLPALPRGDYRVAVDGPGLTIWRPLALSRDQDVGLELVSYLDIGLVLTAGVTVLLGLLFLGRPSLLGFLGSWRDPSVALDRVVTSLLVGMIIAIVLAAGPPIMQRYVFSEIPKAQGGPLDVPTSRPQALPPSAPVAAQPQTYEVQTGDTLRSIALKVYGNEADWQRLLDANQSEVNDPDALTVGQLLLVPRD